MVIIFNDVFKIVRGYLSKLYTAAMKKRVLLKVSCFLLVSITALVITVLSTGLTIGYRVNYDGEEIAVIAKSSVFDKAVSLLSSMVNGENAEIDVKKPEFSLTLTVSNQMLSARNLADIIIDKSDNVAFAQALIVNGKTVATVENFDAQAYIDSRLAAYNIDGADNSSEFSEDVSIESGYYVRADIDTLSDFIAAADSLQVKTVSTVVTNVEIPYSTVKEKTDKKLIGYSSVTVKGQNGLEQKTEKIVSINGEEQERSLISEVTLTSPVNEVVVVGTAKSLASAAQRSAAASAGFVFPLPKGSWTVTAYYGDGRGHKGMDLAADKGTSVFAVSGGTVTFAGVDGNYGYCVVIDHGNGIKTRYAHASKLLVSAGETVTRGEVIANVGSTGYSTGNHLHFEVLVNNKNVDPAPYIGIR